MARTPPRTLHVRGDLDRAPTSLAITLDTEAGPLQLTFPAHKAFAVAQDMMNGVTEMAFDKLRRTVGGTMAAVCACGTIVPVKTCGCHPGASIGLLFAAGWVLRVDGRWQCPSCTPTPS